MMRINEICRVIMILGLGTLAGCLGNAGDGDSSFAHEADAEGNFADESDPAAYDDELAAGEAALSTEAVLPSETTAASEAERQGALARLKKLYEQVKDGEGAEVYALAPELNGLRVKIPGRAAIYLIDRGKRRHIPDEATYDRLFRDRTGVDEAYFYALIEEGAALSSQATLMQGRHQLPVYLVEQGTKRWISSPATMDRYYFDGDKIIVVPPFVLAYMFDGPAI